MRMIDLTECAAKIKLIAFDNDGVMTDGRVYINAEGTETKAFDIRDGFGVVMGRRAGLKFVIITGLKSAIVETRAAQLGIEEVHQGFVEKADVLRDVMQRHGLERSEIAFMGDDLFDIPAMRLAGFSATPADSHPDVQKAAYWISNRPGGRGAVRELIEFIIKARGQWEEMMDIFVQK